MNYPLNRTITIRKTITGTSAALANTYDYEDYMTTYANVYPRSRAVKFGESEEYVDTTDFTIRHNKLSKEINNKYKIVYDEQTYSIIEIQEVEYRRFLKIICHLYYGE